jgi:pilus assembly protein CpaF
LRFKVEELLIKLTLKRKQRQEPPPLIIELLQEPSGEAILAYEAYPFSYRVTRRGRTNYYHVFCGMPPEFIGKVRRVVQEISEGLDPDSVEPLTFERLIEVLTEHAAALFASTGAKVRIGELSELAAYEAIGLSRILALAKDEHVTEFFVDSDSSPIYLDHSGADRCETGLLLTERERQALETHVDTFRGYSLDYKTPSLKNDLEISGAILRISLDLEPISVNRFAMDVRRLNVTSLTLPRLVGLNVISEEAAGFLVAWLESGGNVTIVGETGTGKTTLLNALDEQMEPKLRRLYIEDAVETADLIGRGFHQLKLKVDPFERGHETERTKEKEIVKALHRSPDVVILSEIQSEEHSRAFFHALSAGARGMQTFHASSPEQAIRRWVNMHGVPRDSIADLGVLVQMTRPDRLKQGRYVLRICGVSPGEGVPRVRDLFSRDEDFNLRMVSDPALVGLPAPSADFQTKMSEAARRVAGGSLE